MVIYFIDKFGLELALEKTFHRIILQRGIVHVGIMRCTVEA